MPLYEYRCTCGGLIELLSSPSAASPTCPDCGAQTRKQISAFAVGGRANPGLSQSEMPQTWQGTYAGNPEYVTALQHQWEQRQRLEERHPELRGDRRPVVAHEGPFSTTPLRSGDPIPSAATASGHETGHAHAHLHPHGHSDAGSSDDSQ